MSKSDTFENDLLKLILNGTAIANLADNAATSPATNLYLALHTADPTDSGNQTTNEVSYTSYARAAVARTSGGWTILGNTANLTTNIDFPAATGGSSTATHFSLGTASAGTGKILYSGALNASLAIITGVTPRLNTTTTISED